MKTEAQGEVKAEAELEAKGVQPETKSGAEEVSLRRNEVEVAVEEEEEEEEVQMK